MNKPRSPWLWIPTLYFAEGIPYVAVMTVSVIMYKRCGLTNTQVALFSGLIGFVWVFKGLWSPFVDLLKTKRWWILTAQLLLGAGLGGIALLIPAPFFLQATLAMFILLALCSATHDIAADGFYMLELNDSQQSFYVGIRNTFYRFANIFGQGLLIMLAGFLEKSTGNIRYAWSITFFILAGIILLIFAYHRFALPVPVADRPSIDKSAKNIFSEFKQTFVSFFSKKQVGVAIAFMLLYRFSEALLVKISSLFMLDPRNIGGLELSTEKVGFVYGTVGVIALTLGGIVGGIAVSQKGLKYWLLPMALCITLPHIVYVYLAYYQPTDFILINVAVALEQFGYGFGFTAYMLYLIYFSDGAHKTAHYAIATAFMAMSMSLPGMVAGWLQEKMGYEHFFVFIMLCSLTTWAIIPFLKIEKDFGKKIKN
ncbi:MAG: MFS transporter [Prevotellaceae bacterium]|jgi:PAT family beta-lactamase induction signal transducer AmpG|nr:MFS transporter [Prevotellaceae bacterium]